MELGEAIWMKRSLQLRVEQRHLALPVVDHVRSQLPSLPNPRHPSLGVGHRTTALASPGMEHGHMPLHVLDIPCLSQSRN